MMLYIHYKYLLSTLSHKWEVGKVLWKFGLYKQAISHDCSKFSFVESKGYANWYYNKNNRQEKHLKQLNRAWLHHRGRNLHHPEYWVDFNDNKEPDCFIIPLSILVEIVADYVGAGKVYNKDNFTIDEPIKYFANKCDKIIMEENSFKMLTILIAQLKLQTFEELSILYKDKKLNNIYKDEVLLNEYYVEAKNLIDVYKEENYE